MARTTGERGMRGSSLQSVFDAIHGSINVADASEDLRTSTIPELLVSPPLQRLRRVKQLDFASQAFPAADHSRFAHALGTMHVMRKLNAQLGAAGQSFDVQATFLREQPQSIFIGNDEAVRLQLAQHLLLAGLLQDLGELPYSQATRYIYKPRAALRRDVAKSTGIARNRLTDKAVFTLAALHFDKQIHDKRLFDGIDLHLLTYLITGESAVEGAANALKPLRHMTDGVVDADRLDYVFRDAHHTIGSLGNVDSVIDTIVCYDEHGPIFSDFGPVANFLVTRARLYSTVYLSSANRFRVQLLITALRGIRNDDTAAGLFFREVGTEISYEDFLELDEFSLNSRLGEFVESKLVRRLDANSRAAVELFTGKTYKEYHHFWVAPPANESDALPDETVLPDDLFFDTLRDQQRPIYFPGSVRIKNESIRYIGETMPLEECAGPYSGIFQPQGLTLPMKDAILVYQPSERRKGAWAGFDKALKDGSLYKALLARDPVRVVDFPTDTRRNGYGGPDIFLSFANDDIELVRSVAAALRSSRRRYYFYGSPYQGVGDTALHNSEQAVRDADAVIVIASLNYVSRYRDDPDGYVMTEVFEMSNRRSRDPNFPVVVLSGDEMQAIKEFPWRRLGFDEAPYVGRPLRNAAQPEVNDAVAEALTAIEQTISGGGPGATHDG